jgi:Ca-activated chloride channel family protein
MRKVFIVSGVMLTILLVPFLFGVFDFGNGVRKYILEGNSHYAAGEYDNALEAYKTGLDREPESKKLGYNSGQVSYILKDYQQAANFFVNSSDNEDKYMNWGNSLLRLGNEATDDTLKFRCYSQALEVYKQGILSYPENMELKYNYEYVLDKIGMMDNKNENQQDRESEDQQNNDGEDQQNQDGENQQNQEEESQDQNGGESQQDSGQDENSGSEEQENSQQDEQEGESDQQDEQEGESDQQDEQEGESDRQDESGSNGDRQDDNQQA